MSSGMAEREVATHEAAHAVVGVRLGLPVLYATTRRNDLSSEDRRRVGREGFSRGQVAIDPAAFPSVQAGQALTEVERKAHESLALQIAAGLLVEYRRYGQRALTDGGATDVGALFETANLLGIVSVPVGTTADLAEYPGFWPWVTQCVNEAAAVLDQDHGAAWDRVRVALQRKRFLTGDEVRALVATSEGQGPSNGKMGEE